MVGTLHVRRVGNRGEHALPEARIASRSGLRQPRDRPFSANSAANRETVAPIDSAFSLFEVRVILRTILRHARFRVATTPVESAVRMNISLVPKHGGRVVLDRA